MDKQTELHHLQKIKKELDTIVNNLEDIKLWLVKNENDMVSDLSDSETELADAINSIQDVALLLEMDCEELEEEIANES
jgi:GTPase involved in cell partitioning and DNA repair